MHVKIQQDGRQVQQIVTVILVLMIINSVLPWRVAKQCHCDSMMALHSNTFPSDVFLTEKQTKKPTSFPELQNKTSCFQMVSLFNKYKLQFNNDDDDDDEETSNVFILQEQLSSQTATLL